MISLTVGLWACSGALIGLMALFSMQNKKSGWKRTRTTLSEALEDFYSDLGLAGVPVQTSATNRGTSVLTAPDVNDFSRQLSNLKGALIDNSRVAEESPSHLVPELVAVKAR